MSHFFLILFWSWNLQFNTDAIKYIIFKNYSSEIYSNSSTTKLDEEPNYFIFWTNLVMNYLTCTPNCSSILKNQNLSFAILCLFSNEYEFRETKIIQMAFRFHNISAISSFQLKFKSNLSEIKHTCFDGYFVNLKDNQLPFCNFTWCNSAKCVEFRNQTYTYSRRYFDSGRSVFVKKLSPSLKTLIHNITVYLDIKHASNGKLIGTLLTKVTMYYIDKIFYQCSYGNDFAVPLNLKRGFDGQCVLKEAIPFIQDCMNFYVNNITQTSWDVQIQLAWNPLAHPHSEELIFDHILYLKLSNLSLQYYLKRDIFLLYTKYDGKDCTESLLAFYNPCVTCIKGVNNESDFYIKINTLSNQDNNSYFIENTIFCINNLWVPEIVTKITGSLYLRSINTDVPEILRKIQDFSFNVEYSIITNFDLSPKTGSINLPVTFIAKCDVYNHTEVTISLHGANFLASNNTCYVELNIPVLNISSIIVKTFINYGKYWSNYSHEYPVGRIPSIVMITSRYPKFGERVQCLTDGIDHLYAFSWACNTSNEPRDLVVVDYITFDNAFLTFHETSPLIKFHCICSCIYITSFGREVFSVSATIEFDLVDNGMENCEMAYEAQSDLAWVIVVIYVLVTLMIPLVFIITAYFVTISKFKETIQSEIISRLGFAKQEIIRDQDVMPYVVMDKTDIGESVFKTFQCGLQELEKNAINMKTNRKPCFHRTLQKTSKINPYNIPLQKSSFIALKIDKRIALLKELENRQLARSFSSSNRPEYYLFKKKSSGIHDMSKFSVDSIPDENNLRKYTLPLPEIVTPWRKHSLSLPSSRSDRYDAIKDSVMMTQMKRILGKTSKGSSSAYRPKLGVWTFRKSNDEYY